jgi:hypothetical protein
MRKTELLLLAALATANAFAQGDTPDPPSRIARLNYLSGTVSFRPGTVDEWTAATLNYPIYNGDHLWADRGARAELHIGSTALRMDSETALAILNLDDRTVQLSLTGGALEVRLRALDDSESFEVDTPNAAVTLLRAGEYRLFVDGEGNLTTVTVRGGDAEVTGGGSAFTVHARESARLSGADDSFRGDVNSAAPPDDFEFWCQTRDRREEQSQSVHHVSREMIGYEDLDEHGVWSEVPDYGWVWAPRVQAGWAPYREGHWVWVDPWGWTWVDDAPWGFAPFHYGRWANYRGGWVWVPGTVVARPVYAPALVAFVGVAGVAWFPLGPHEVYRPAYRVSEVYVRQVNITHVNVTNINVTNVRYVNQGIGVTAVSQNVFVNARPVHHSLIAVNANVMGQAQVMSAAPVAPERASVLGRAQASPGMAPPARFADRAVIVRTPPPPSPVSFGARREAMQANPGRPLDFRTVERLRSNDHTRGPEIRPAIPQSPPIRPVREERAQPVIMDSTRVRPDRPVRPAQQQEPAPAQRPVERPRAPQQNVEQPRSEQRREATGERKEQRSERKQEQKKKEERKQEERKQQ